MKWSSLDALEGNEPYLDLRRYPLEQIATLLDLVRLDCFLDYAYVTILRREPDRAGRNHYHKRVANGMRRSAIISSLLRSSEYRLSSVDSAGLTVEEFVNRAYQDILGRWPDQEGLETYRRIASKTNGKRRVIGSLQASSEAIRKGGGRFARIERLRSYAKANWPTRLPIIGQWFENRRKIRQRFSRIELNHHLLAEQLVSLKNDIEELSLAGTEPFGFEATVQTDGIPRDIFQNALIRARRTS